MLVRGIVWKVDERERGMGASGAGGMRLHAETRVRGGKKSELRSDWQAEACPTKAVRAALGLTGDPEGTPPAPPRTPAEHNVRRMLLPFWAAGRDAKTVLGVV